MIQSRKTGLDPPSVIVQAPVLGVLWLSWNSLSCKFCANPIRVLQPRVFSLKSGNCSKISAALQSIDIQICFK